MRMKRLAAVIAVAALLATTGCEESSSNGRIAPNTQPAADPGESPGGQVAPAAPPDEETRTIYLIHLQLATVEVPLTVASDSEELWSRLDEEPVILRSHILGMNGFRVGLGRKEDWPEIERTLKKMTGQNLRIATVQMAAGQPAPVELQSSRPERLIFLTHEDRTLSGRHVPPGDYLLTFTGTLDEDDPSRLLLTVVPQIRTTRRFPTIVRQGAAATLEHRPHVETLLPLAFQMTVPNNDFLIIGPGVQARRPTSPGHFFLTQDRQGVPFETVLLLRPMVHAVQLTAPPPSAE